MVSACFLHFLYFNIYLSSVLAVVRVSLYSGSMSKNINAESSKQLLELAQEHGYSVSTTQLARWHRAGILPRPEQQSLGRGQGTQSLYPVGTGEQLLLLCELHRHERRLIHLAWRIWWEGYPVDLQLIWKILQQTAAQLSERIGWFIALRQLEQATDDKGLEGSEQVLDFIEQFATVDLDYKPLRRIRKRLGKEQFTTFMRMLIDIATGIFQEHGTIYDRREVLAELRILAKGLGQNEQFLKDDVNIEHFIEKILVPLLQDTSFWLQTLPWEAALHTATKFDLLQARDEIRVMSTRFEQNKQAMAFQQAKMRDYPFWGSVWQKIFPVLTTNDQAILLVMQLALRSDASSSNNISPWS